MRLIILTIFAICMAGTAQAQTEFNFSCYEEEIAAIPEAMMDDPNGPLFDRVKYINDIITPDGFSINADEERIVVHEGLYPGGTQRWYHDIPVNIISYDDFNFIYKAIHRVLINLKYGYEPKTGTGL